MEKLLTILESLEKTEEGILTLLFWISKEKRPLEALEVDASKFDDT